MKRPGSTLEFEQERNLDLLRAYREQISLQLSQTGRISISKVYREVVKMPAKRFWVSPERALNVVSLIIKGKTPPMRPTKLAMYNEIYRRVEQERKLHGKIPLTHLVEIVVEQEAPAFYMTPDTARLFIWKAKKKCLEERKRKLRHLF
ncbi:MAG: hypothetical protein IJ197_08710 [Bacteroidaceae bacterium]|nr:hypothetical protein [Bacteroidaceae bacterium]